MTPESTAWGLEPGRQRFSSCYFRMGPSVVYQVYHRKRDPGSNIFWARLRNMIPLQRDVGSASSPLVFRSCTVIHAKWDPWKIARLVQISPTIFWFLIELGYGNKRGYSMLQPNLAIVWGPQGPHCGDFRRCSISTLPTILTGIKAARPDSQPVQFSQERLGKLTGVIVAGTTGNCWDLPSGNLT